MFIGVVDLHILYALELFQRPVQRTRKVISGPVGLAITGQIEAQDVAIQFEVAVSDKTVLYSSHTFRLFRRTWTLEVLVQRTGNRILRGRNDPGDRLFMRRSPGV